MPTMPIFLDHNATTPIDPAVREAMLPFLAEQFGNPSSQTHAFGWQAQMAVRTARDQVAKLLGVQPKEVIWTSGATESNNLALLGVLRGHKGGHIITQVTEHKAVLEVAEAAALEYGATVTVLPVDNEGRVRVSDVEAAIRPETVLCSIMAANNEVGTLQPIAEIAQLCHERGVIFHCDAAQAVGKEPLDLRQLPIDLLSLSGHKMYGPKGVGALIYRPKNREFALKPLFFGGEQERGLRPGTLNVPGIVGLGAACVLAQEVMAEERTRLKAYQAQVLDAVESRFRDGVLLNGPRERRLCHNLNLSFPGRDREQMMLDLSGLAYSSGSACSSADPKPSHVLLAMGQKPEVAKTSVRLGFGRFTTREEVTVVIDKLTKMLSDSVAI